MFSAPLIPVMPLLFWGMPGGGEMVLILIIGPLVFGGRLPEVARQIGKGIQEFKKGIGEFDSELRAPLREATRIDPPRGSFQRKPVEEIPAHAPVADELGAKPDAETAGTESDGTDQAPQ